MATQTLVMMLELSLITCSKCGMTFGVPREFQERRRGDHESFWCPNGHSQYYPAKTETEKLKEQLKEVKWALKLEQQAAYEEYEAHRQTRARLRATKAAHTRTKKRIHNGVCPVCNRHFKVLERHMHDQHPDYAADEEGA